MPEQELRDDNTLDGHSTIGELPGSASHEGNRKLNKTETLAHETYRHSKHELRNIGRRAEFTGHGGELIMARNANLVLAQKTKNDEFYTQYGDIEAEMTAYVRFNTDVFRDKTILLPCDDYQRSNFTKYFAENFTRFGLKKLISTSYARSTAEHSAHGKLFTLTRDNDNGCVESKGYLEGNGDFRSAEVTALRDEADIIITNPPFSLFREFLAWIMEADKQFIIIGNINAVKYIDMFQLLKDNRV